jgi:hypothetical protein
MGATGYAFGGHLHFEIIKDGAHIDPTNYIFGGLAIVPEVAPPTNNEDNNNQNNDNEQVPTPKIIFTCPVEDNYYLHLKVGEKIYFSED